MGQRRGGPLGRGGGMEGKRKSEKEKE